MKLKTQFFRANVGIVVTDGSGQVLAFERIDTPGAWQLPQGGLDLGEEPWETAVRELEEETGVGPGSFSLIAEHPDWLAYELPEERRRPSLGRGQVQKWFLVRLDAEDSILDPTGVDSPEFGAWKWTDFESLIEEVVPFRRSVYRRLAEAFETRLSDR